MKNKTSKYKSFVLDSYAILAYLGDEAGRNFVESLFKEALVEKYLLYMTTVNLGEVAYIVERERGLPGAQKALSKINELPIDVITVDSHIALEAAHIKAKYPISYADCFVVSLSLFKNAVIVTGDPEFHKVTSEYYNLQIEWLT